MCSWFCFRERIVYSKAFVWWKKVEKSYNFFSNLLEWCKLYGSLHMMYITTNFIIAIIKTYMSCFSTALDALASAPGFLNKWRAVLAFCRGRTILSRLSNVFSKWYIFKWKIHAVREVPLLTDRAELPCMCLWIVCWFYEASFLLYIVTSISRKDDEHLCSSYFVTNRKTWCLK